MASSMKMSVPAANKCRNFSSGNKVTLLVGQVPVEDAQVKVAPARAQVKVAPARAQVKVALARAQMKVGPVQAVVAQVKVPEAKAGLIKAVDLVAAEVSALPTQSWKRLIRIKTAH
jgi:hypothetical protein